MNSVNELFHGFFEIAALIVSLAVIAVLVRSPNTADVIQSSAQGFGDVLSSAIGESGGLSAL